MNDRVLHVEDGLGPEVGLAIGRGWAHETLAARGLTGRVLAWLADLGPTTQTWWHVGATVSFVGIVDAPDRAVEEARRLVARLDRVPHLPPARLWQPDEPDGHALQRRWGWASFGLLAAPHLGHRTVSDHDAAAWLDDVGNESALLWARNVTLPDDLALARDGRRAPAIDPAWRGRLPRHEATVDVPFTVSWVEGPGTAAHLLSQWWASHLLDLVPDPVPGQAALWTVRRGLTPTLHHVTVRARTRLEEQDVATLLAGLRQLEEVAPPEQGSTHERLATVEEPPLARRIWDRLHGPAAHADLDDAHDPAAIGARRDDLAASLLVQLPPGIGERFGVVTAGPGAGVAIDEQARTPVPGAVQLLGVPRHRLAVGGSGVGMAWHDDRDRSPRHVGIRRADVGAVLRWEDGQRLVWGLDDTRLLVDPVFWARADRWLSDLDDLGPVVPMQGPGPPAPWSRETAGRLLTNWGLTLVVVLLFGVALFYAGYGLLGRADDQLPWLVGLVLGTALLAAANLPSVLSWHRVSRRVRDQLGRSPGSLTPPPVDGLAVPASGDERS